MTPIPLRLLALAALALLPAFPAAPGRDPEATRQLRAWALAHRDLDPASALARVMPLAQGGNTTAQVLAATYRMQQGAPREEVVPALQQAAALGNPLGMVILAQLGRGLAGSSLDRDRYGLDPVEALGWLHRCLALPMGPEEIPASLLNGLYDEAQQVAPRLLDAAAWARLEAWEPPAPMPAALDRSLAHGDPYALAFRGRQLLGQSQAPEGERLLREAGLQGNLWALWIAGEQLLLPGRPAGELRDPQLRPLLQALLNAAEAGVPQAMDLAAALLAREGQPEVWGRTDPGALGRTFAHKAAQAGLPRAMGFHARNLFELGALEGYVTEARRWVALAGGREPRLQPALLRLEAQARQADLEARSPFDPRHALWEGTPAPFQPPVPRFPRRLQPPRKGSH